MLKDHIVQATIPAQDLERAKRFYSETVGLGEGHEAAGGVFFRSGSAHFFLFKSSGQASGAHTQMGWPVDDIEAEVDELRKRGVTFEEYDSPDFKTENGIFTAGEIKSAWFRDSEGNLLAITQGTESGFSVGSNREPRQKGGNK